MSEAFLDYPALDVVDGRARDERHFVIEILLKLRAASAQAAGTAKPILIAVAQAIVLLYPVQHQQLRVEALQNDLGREPIVAALVLPFPRRQLALKKDLAALAQEAFGDPDQPFGKDGDRHPFGALFLLTIGFPALGYRDTEVADLAAILEGSRLGISAQIADDLNLVKHHAAFR